MGPTQVRKRPPFRGIGGNRNNFRPNRAVPPAVPPTNSSVRCYRCGGMGHYANKCGTPDSYRDGKPLNDLFPNQNPLASNQNSNNNSNTNPTTYNATSSGTTEKPNSNTTTKSIIKKF